MGDLEIPAEVVIGWQAVVFATWEEWEKVVLGAAQVAMNFLSTLHSAGDVFPIYEFDRDLVRLLFYPMH